MYIPYRPILKIRKKTVSDNGHRLKLPKFYCTKCQTTKTEKDFTRDIRRSRGHSYQCKQCRKEYLCLLREKYPPKTGCWWVDMYIKISLIENKRVRLNR